MKRSVAWLAALTVAVGLSMPTIAAADSGDVAHAKLVGVWQVRAVISAYSGPVIDAIDNPIGFSWTSTMTFWSNCTSGGCVATSGIPSLSVSVYSVPSSFARHGTGFLIGGLQQSGATYSGSTQVDVPVLPKTPTECSLPRYAMNQTDSVQMHVTTAHQVTDGWHATSLSGTETTPVMATCALAVQYDVITLTATQVTDVVTAATPSPGGTGSTAGATDGNAATPAAEVVNPAVSTFSTSLPMPAAVARSPSSLLLSALLVLALGSMEAAVFAQAKSQQDVEEAANARLQNIEALARWATSLAVVVAALLLIVSTRLRRRLERRSTAQRRVNAAQDSHDALTGLPNRVYFSQQLEDQLATARAEGGSVGIFLLDLDRFKEINDTLGHHYGDLLLGQIGPRLRGVLRRGEVLARIGGDEFAMLMPTTSVGETAEAELRAIGDRTLSALHAPFLVDGVALAVEASAGIAVYPEHGSTGEELLQCADIAMYVAKGKHVEIAFYDSSLHEYNPGKLALLSQLRVAVDNRQLVLYYQPLVDITTNQVRGAEALVRWQHPEHGLLPPSDFIPLAEGSGFIHELTRSVLRTACLQAMDWQREGHPLVVSVNVSARCLLDVSLPDTVAATLAEVGLSPRLLKLEITESAIIADAGRAENVIDRLHGLGVAMSIDDFGTGYGSLSYLRNLPVQELKIDRSFVSEMLSHPKDEVIVRTGIELASRLGLDSVAEGVEDATTLAALAALGCTVAQGYHLGRPMPADVFHAWLVQRELGAAKALAAIA